MREITMPCYASIDDVAEALDVRASAYRRKQLARALSQASRSVEALTGINHFYPITSTKYFDWPNDQYAETYRLWLERDLLESVSSLTSGGTTLAEGTDFILRPDNDPPYNRIEIYLSGSAGAFVAGSSNQRSILITGVWCGTASTTEDYTTVGALVDASYPYLTVANSADLGPGDLILIGTERLLITDKVFTTLGENVSAALTASVTDNVITLTSTVHEDENIRVGSERMRVREDMGSDTYLVERGYDGSILSEHSIGDPVWVDRVLGVSRGRGGTTAASHAPGATVAKHIYPPSVKTLTIAETIDRLEQETSAYARTIGQGEYVRSASGVGIESMRRTVIREFGTGVRTAAI